jgi:hypothetical protein
MDTMTLLIVFIIVLIVFRWRLVRQGSLVLGSPPEVLRSVEVTPDGPVTCSPISMPHSTCPRTHSATDCTNTYSSLLLS